MGHETIVHGYIEGSTFIPEEYRKFQSKNCVIISQLPAHDEYPYLSKSMFSIPGQGYDEGTYRSQIIHFGGSIKGLEFGDELLWVQKFEALLKKLYWFSAVAYIETEMDGDYKYSWFAAEDIIPSYHGECPLTTHKWQREVQHDGKIVESI